MNGRSPLESDGPILHRLLVRTGLPEQSLGAVLLVVPGGLGAIIVRFLWARTFPGLRNADRGKGTNLPHQGRSPGPAT